MSYASIQAIREGAGLLNRVNNETPAGAINGSNRDFVVVRRPIVDGNYDDVVGKEDVQVFVDEIPVAVTAVDAASGKITLAVAPANDTSVTVDYQFSPITDEYTQTKQVEADSWIDLKIGGYIGVPLQDVPGIITTAAEMYAAGLILTRDWGSRVDSELTSKDGFNKIKQARDLVADYIQGLKDAKLKKHEKDGTQNDVATAGDHDIFNRHEHELGREFGGPTDDEFFMRRR